MRLLELVYGGCPILLLLFLDIVSMMACSLKKLPYVYIYIKLVHMLEIS